MAGIYYYGTHYYVAIGAVTNSAFIGEYGEGVDITFEPGADTDDLLRALEKCPSHDAKEALLASYF